MNLERLAGGQLGNRQQDTPASLTLVPLPTPAVPMGRPPGSRAPLAVGAQGALGVQGGSQVCCFPFQPQLVPGFVISKGDKAPDGRKLAGAQGAGPSALGASQKIVPWKQGSCP